MLPFEVAKGELKMATENTITNPHVLIAEDEVEIADTLKYVLESEGFESLWVSRGGQVLSLLQQQSIDLIILDVGLPDCNGFELLKTIRKTSDLPVMMLTARSNEVDRVVGLEIGADDYVTKPFSPREVVARVKAILKRTRSVVADQSPRFEIDKPAMLIRYCGHTLDLTKSEYLLLEALLSHPGHTLSRRQLIDRVWSTNHPSEDRVIDTHIKSLRAKLKRIDHNADAIETHRGFGYSIQA